MRSTMCPITCAKKNTKVFTTPWISASVTMSPLAIWVTSWPITASASSWLICCNRPVDTATSALLRLMPVAKAFMSGEL